MKKTITRYSFARDFEALRPDNFTREGLDILFDYLVEYEADTGIEIEFDVIGLCCDFSESEPREIAEMFDGIDITDCADDCEVFDLVKEYLIDEGLYIGETTDFDVTLIYRNA